MSETTQNNFRYLFWHIQNTPWATVKHSVCKTIIKKARIRQTMTSKVAKAPKKTRKLLVFKSPFLFRSLEDITKPKAHEYSSWSVQRDAVVWMCCCCKLLLLSAPHWGYRASLLSLRYHAALNHICLVHYAYSIPTQWFRPEGSGPQLMVLICNCADYNNNK